MLLHVCVCVSVAVPERSLRQRGGIVYVGLLWDVGLCWFWGRTGCPQGGGTAFTGLYPAAGPEGPSWSGSRACACVGCGGACVSKPPSTKFYRVRVSCPGFRLCMSTTCRGSKRTPTTSFRFRVSRVTPAEPRSDSRTRRRSKIARKTCVLQIAFSAPRLRRPNSSGSPQNASEPGRQSGTRPGAVLGSWYATTSNAAARETPRHQGTAVWQAGLRE